MRIELKRFGDFLSSRSEGREAWLVTKAYILRDLKSNEKIEIDFSGVKVFTPSWGDEFLSALIKEYPGQVILLPSENPTVKASLEFVKLK